MVTGVLQDVTIYLGLDPGLHSSWAGVRKMETPFLWGFLPTQGSLSPIIMIPEFLLQPPGASHIS